MTSEDLVAFIPVFKEHAVKNRWMNMPFPPLVDRLMEKTGGRLLPSDGKIPTARQLDGLPMAAQKAFLESVQREPGGLYFEYRFG